MALRLVFEFCIVELLDAKLRPPVLEREILLSLCKYSRELEL